MKKSFNGRRFQLWHYRVSLSQLLIRSPKNKDERSNIDIMFFDVEYLELPRFLEDLQILEVESKDVRYIKKKLGKSVEESKITVLLSKNKRYFLVSSHMKIEENELDLFETSFEKVGIIT